MQLKWLSLVIQSFWWGIKLWGLNSYTIPLPSLHGREGSSFPGLIPPNAAINSESVMGIKPDDSSVVTGYQGDDLLTSDMWNVLNDLCLVHGANLAHFPPE